MAGNTLTYGWRDWSILTGFKSVCRPYEVYVTNDNNRYFVNYLN